MTKLQEAAHAIHAVEFEPGDSIDAATMGDPPLCAFRMSQACAALTAISTPDMNIIMRIAGETGMRPGEVDLAVTRYIEAILKEPQ